MMTVAHNLSNFNLRIVGINLPVLKFIGGTSTNWGSRIFNNLVLTRSMSQVSNPSDFLVYCSDLYETPDIQNFWTW